jgi:pimeloyl-ACP methyl ester carboxylesterase
MRGGVLILPGGKQKDTTAARVWQLANLRMIWLAWSLRRRLGQSIEVRRVQYRKRGWNSPALDALRDAESALDRMRRDVDHVVLVGHSMGGRVAVHLSGSSSVSGVVALAPWWPRSDADLVPTSCRLLAIHGTADTWTDPRSSRAQTHSARDRGVDAQWVEMPNAGHFLVRDFQRWHRLTAEFVAKQLQVPLA